ncbi:hypothetical protein J2T12_001215 [Paenibacillus anaericanus]|uniref:Copper amine oxidase n=1 Tax=Paenibacillus anaericanus TaxID=170367 RepID=A0A3S1BV45_9BACL|nr:stalk domain-containing protein [Paenibacillus anaericanus]MDQ0087809.1 hypothetical protein [Paenibacillus anaericanus]RUT48158.1 copper amine oxidase [Paenibacillus anaericanus]
MKKWTYLLSGILIGVLITTSGSALAAQVQSLIGKKVTGEYTVIVDSKTLTDKGAIIDSRANIPVRAFADAIGAEVKVSGKTITVTTNAGSKETSGNADSSTTNIFIGRTKQQLEDSKKVLENDMLPPTLKERAELVEEIEKLKKSGSAEALKKKEEQLASKDALIEKFNNELKQVEAALKLLQN